MKKQIIKKDLYAKTDTRKGEISFIPFSGAKLAAKDLVYEEFFVDDNGKRQGPCKQYNISMEHADNPPIDGKGYETIVGEYDGRQITTYLATASHYVDDVKQGQEICYYSDGRVLSITSYEDGKAKYVVNFGGPNKGLTSIAQCGDDGKTFEGTQIFFGDSEGIFSKPIIEDRIPSKKTKRDKPNTKISSLLGHLKGRVN